MGRLSSKRPARRRWSGAILDQRPGRLPVGFALLEVLLTLTLAAFALAALIRFQIALGRDGELARQRGTAATLAGARLEMLRAALGNGPFAGAQAGSEIDAQSAAEFRVSWSATDGALAEPIALQVKAAASGHAAADTTVALYSAMTPRSADSGVIVLAVDTLRPP